jgi:anti-sigma B factor antagonist
MMNLRRRMVGPVAVVSLAGGLDSESAPAVQDKLSKLLQQQPYLLIDFAGVPCVSSAGLRTLLLLYRQAQGLNHQVGVVGMSPVADVVAALDIDAEEALREPVTSGS